jgi:hypothetical protein
MVLSIQKFVVPQLVVHDEQLIVGVGRLAQKLAHCLELARSRSVPSSQVSDLDPEFQNTRSGGVTCYFNT